MHEMIVPVRGIESYIATRETGIRHAFVNLGMVVLPILQDAHDGAVVIIRRQWLEADVVQPNTDVLSVFFRLCFDGHDS